MCGICGFNWKDESLVGRMAGTMVQTLGSQLQAAFELTVSSNPTRYLQSVRAYVGGQGSFANVVSPALYGLTATQFPDYPLLNLGSDLPAQLDIVLQATICNAGGDS